MNESNMAADTTPGVALHVWHMLDELEGVLGDEDGPRLILDAVAQEIDGSNAAHWHDRIKILRDTFAVALDQLNALADDLGVDRDEILGSALP